MNSRQYKPSNFRWQTASILLATQRQLLEFLSLCFGWSASVIFVLEATQQSFFEPRFNNSFFNIKELFVFSNLERMVLKLRKQKTFFSGKWADLAKKPISHMHPHRPRFSSTSLVHFLWSQLLPQVVFFGRQVWLACRRLAAIFSNAKLVSNGVCVYVCEFVWRFDACALTVLSLVWSGSCPPIHPKIFVSSSGCRDRF